MKQRIINVVLLTMILIGVICFNAAVLVAVSVLFTICAALSLTGMVVLLIWWVFSNVPLAFEECRPPRAIGARLP